MHNRYINTEIQRIWSPTSIYNLWEKVELEVIRTRENIGQLPEDTYYPIKARLGQNPIDEPWLDKREAETKHDLNAFLDERRRHLESHQQHIFHQGMTSYDTEEPARALMLQESAKVVLTLGNQVLAELFRLAKIHQHTVMLGVTHGQWAGIMSFGARCAKWYMGLWKMLRSLEKVMEETAVAKLSGAIGTYSEVITPEVELLTLQELGLRPFYGATQIVPRYVWIPLAQSVLNVLEVVSNIAETLRLGARSGYQIIQEPFGKKQKGSSAMPHKRNPITWEKVIGITILARSNVQALQNVCTTWEERDIRESALERNAWPDLFHLAAHSLSCIRRTLIDLVVNKEAMLRQIRDSQGTYATDMTKGWLAKNLDKMGFDNPAELAYRILQHASQQALDPGQNIRNITNQTVSSYEEVDRQFSSFTRPDAHEQKSVEQIIRHSFLSRSEHFDSGTVNSRLLSFFIEHPKCVDEWHTMFLPSTHLEKEKPIFEVLETMGRL